MTPILLASLLLSQAAAQSGPPAPPPSQRYEKCLDLATTNATAAEAEAGQWQLAGGGFLAGQCLGMAYANEQRWTAAAAAFDAAARAAEKAGDGRSANYWAQAGNAWLASGDATKARAALDAALAGGTLSGLPLGEAHLDRARAMVAGDDLEGARDDLDRALAEVPTDPLAWLLSATLARRQQQIVRAKHDIAEALRLGADDPAVQLEAGNIAAFARDEQGARGAWQQAVTLRPDSEPGKAAAAALRQFDTAPAATPSPTAPAAKAPAKGSR
ncbi:tetratricopeptide repeat protein [Sphingomonas sp. RB3P16]|uniref:tetratricopeptide repeat protein n=1 Tax=Parasphingomonas frigoris TaxID=3096163 RepID=UPI002FC81896